MAPILNTQTSTGLPVCLSGITHPLALSKEMADHDRRRKGFIKKLRLRVGKGLHAASADQENIISGGGAATQRIIQDDQVEGVSQEVRDGVSGDLAALSLVLHHLSDISLSSCTAKAA